MAIRKLTFDDSLNTAKDDAFFNWYLTNKTNGIFADLGDECEATSSNGKITFKDGFVSIYGRRIYIENGTSISVSLDSTKKGYVVLKLDTVNNEATLLAKEGTSSNYPSLTQTNLLESDGTFEFPMVGYSKTTTSLALDKSVITFINLNKTISDNVYNTLILRINSEVSKLNDTIEGKQHGMKCEIIQYPSQDRETFKFNISSIINKDACLITFACCNNIFAVSLNLLKGTTNITFSYKYLGTDYQGYLERSGNDLYIELGSSLHSVKKLFCYY